MVHLMFVMDAHPDKHARFKEYVDREVVYEYEGEARKGHHRPLLTEIKLYSVRVKKEFVKEIMTDLQIGDIVGRPKKGGRGWTSGDFIRFFDWPVRLFRRLFNMTGARADPTVRRFRIAGWHNAQLIGVLPDRIDDGEEIL